VSEHEPAATGAEAARGTRIRSLARGCRLLLWLAERPEGATAKEIAFGSRLPLATTYHLLNTLVDCGLLEKGAQRRYVLGAGVATLARARLRGNPVPEGMLLALRELTRRTGAAAYLADWGEHEMRLLACAEGAQTVHFAELASGSIGDAHARASGKLLLAYAPELRAAYLARHPLRRLTEATLCDLGALEDELARIRQQGFARDEQEWTAGVACVAAPLLREGRIVAAFGVAVTAERFARRRDELTETVLDVVAEAAGGAAR
jgi:DNA-binding IclR family transcriptional regulator